MMTRHHIALGIIVTLSSCQTAENNCEQKQTVPSEEVFIMGEIDTTKIISQLAIKESASRFDLSNEKIDNLSNRIDTLELSYYFGFCDCQRWIVSKIYDKASGEDADLNELDPRSQVEFNLDEHGYYIESAHKELEIDWRTAVNGTTIRFIGREYKDKRLPENDEFTVPDPPKGKVFRYYSYQILRPYQIWGPRKLEIDKTTGGSITVPTILKVQ